MLLLKFFPDLIDTLVWDANPLLQSQAFFLPYLDQILQIRLFLHFAPD
jgi:hypothetical protein